MRKKLELLILLLICTFCLSGCGGDGPSFLDKAKACLSDTKQNIEVGFYNNKLSKSTWSGETLKAGSDYMKAAANLEDVKNRTEDDYSFSFWKGITGKGFTAKQQLKYDTKKAESDYASSKSILDLCFNKDDETRAVEKNKQDKKNVSPLKWIIILILIVVIVVLLLKKKKSPEVDTTEESPCLNGVGANTGYDDLQAPDYEGKGRSLCADKGLNYDSILAECNGDKIKALKKIRGI